MLAFASTHAAITAQRALEGRVPFLTMPVLREVSASCGIALRVPPEHLGAIRAALCHDANHPAGALPPAGVLPHPVFPAYHPLY